MEGKQQETKCPIAANVGAIVSGEYAPSKSGFNRLVVACDFGDTPPVGSKCTVFVVQSEQQNGVVGGKSFPAVMSQFGPVTGERTGTTVLEIPDANVSFVFVVDRPGATNPTQVVTTAWRQY